MNQVAQQTVVCSGLLQTKPALATEAAQYLSLISEMNLLPKGPFKCGHALAIKLQ